MDGLNFLLHRRSDGYVETSEGEIAVTMQAVSGQRDSGLLYFIFSPGLNREALEVEWQESDQLCIFPFDIGAALLRHGYAVSPSDAAIAWAGPAPTVSPAAVPSKKVKAAAVSEPVAEAAPLPPVPRAPLDADTPDAALPQHPVDAALVQADTAATDEAVPPSTASAPWLPQTE